MNIKLTFCVSSSVLHSIFNKDVNTHRRHKKICGILGKT